MRAKRKMLPYRQPARGAAARFAILEFAEQITCRSIYPVIHSGFKDGKVKFRKKRWHKSVISFLLSRYFPALAQTILPSYDGY